MTEEIYQDWISDNWINKNHFDYTYGSQDELLTRIGQSWNAGDFWETANGDSKLFYYYEEFNNATGILNLAKEINLDIYPNPTSDKINIAIDWQNPQDCNLTIYDIMGRICITGNLNKKEHTKLQFDLSHLPVGSYYLKITTDKSQISKSFQLLK